MTVLCGGLRPRLTSGTAGIPDQPVTVIVYESRVTQVPDIKTARYDLSSVEQTLDPV